jgi:DNA-binding response OmpR family regulator
MLHLANILVVENDDLIRDFLAEALGLDGYTVQTVADRTSMHAALATQLPNLMIYDLDLDHTTDLPIVDDMRDTRGQGVPMILLTTNEQTARSLPRQNSISYLLKPFDLDDLFGYIAQHIGSAGPGADTPVRARGSGAAHGCVA